MNKTELLDRCARSGEERTLLARVLDKLELAQNRGVPAHTPFLTPGEQAAAADLLTAWGNPRYAAFGGYEGAERNILYFPPDWQEPEDALSDPEGPLAALEGTFPNGAALTHRDILGSLMGLGITREKLGDILILEGKCQVVALREALPILLCPSPIRRACGFWMKNHDPNKKNGTHRVPFFLLLHLIASQAWIFSYLSCIIGERRDLL